MGLTHYSILNQLCRNSDFVFVDPDKKVNYFANRNLNATVVNNLDHGVPFDFALICTPPIFHIPILERCIKSNISNIFVEKPFGGINDDYSSVVNTTSEVSVGYVLRFNPIIQWVKDFIERDKIKTVSGFYFSNTIEKKPLGWRNGLYSGVTNEVGAHVIDLCIYLFSLGSPKIIDTKIKSIISDVDDILIADLEEESIKYHFHFDWVNKDYRKPVFKFEVEMVDGSLVKFDQQKVEVFKDGVLKQKITNVDIASNVPFYLRGVEFTSQMLDFIGDRTTIASSNEALIGRSIINKLITK